MDRLAGMEALVTVADTGGFARAAARLGLSPPAVTRAIAALEARLGVTLLTRTTRSVRPTEAGQHFIEQARHLLNELDIAERQAGGADAAPSGHLPITAPLTFGRLHVAPVLAELLRTHPRISAALVTLDRVVDLLEEGHDAAVRIGELADSSMIARRPGEVRRLVVASPAYLARHGIPQAPADLRRHALIAFGMAAARSWPFQIGARPVAIDLAPRLVLTDAAAALAMAEAGEGLTMLQSYQAANALAEGRLAQVLGDVAPAPQPVHIVYPAARIVAAKVRAFVEHAAPALTSRLTEVARIVNSANR